MIFLELFLGFLKVGCFSFGGAYAAIPIIRDVVLSYGWLTDDMLSYMIAVSESTPGPIMVNLATYIGQSRGGLLGAAIATVTVVLPAFVIIILVVTVFDKLLKYKYVRAALDGIIPAVVGVITAVGAYMLAKALFGIPDGFSFGVKDAVIAIAVAAVAFPYKRVIKKKPSPIMLIVLSAVLGILIY